MKVLRVYQDTQEEESRPELAEGQDIHQGANENTIDQANHEPRAVAVNEEPNFVYGD